jgi:hypothetical protein
LPNLAICQTVILGKEIKIPSLFPWFSNLVETTFFFLGGYKISPK